ncbi:MAG: gamma-glutamylcyclotransferase [Christensenellaceae bacterium]|jgi:hypothetical protein|nr:gamma-glutamylcyclotransferase [Christensenellaceae bacterium]
MEKSQYYIAYGSNLNVKHMRVRCPSAVLIGSAILEGYQLVFKYFATIEEKHGAEMPVGIWEIDDITERSLDRYEGYPHLYRKAYIKFKLGNQETHGLCYIMNNGNLELPSSSYFTTIEMGYDHVGLDKNYLIKAYEHTKELINKQK